MSRKWLTLQRDRLNESVDFAEKQLEKLNDLQPITYECRKDA